MTNEVWKDIPKQEGYQVSNTGRVRSRWVSNGKCGDKWHEIMGRKRDGYHSMKINHKYYRVHRLVLEAFVGPRPIGMECRHLNDIRDDNRLENLCWGSRKENSEDMFRNGHAIVGSSCNWAKLTETQVKEIRQKRQAGMMCEDLAKEYGVRPSCVSRITNNKRWKHVA